ncbi:hypothetical protein [Edaphobacter modestus]|nr:hypothetical protein [Edaphobacter modestus]
MHFTQQGAVKRKSNRSVLMNYMLRDGWQISFLEEDCKTSLPRRLVFHDPGKILEMQIRWGEEKTNEDVQQTMRDIAIGRPGSIWLILTLEQYSKLTAVSPDAPNPSAHPSRAFERVTRPFIEPHLKTNVEVGKVLVFAFTVIDWSEIFIDHRQPSEPLLETRRGHRKKSNAPQPRSFCFPYRSCRRGIKVG